MKKTRIAIGCLLLALGVGTMSVAQESRVEIPAAGEQNTTSPLAGWTFGVTGGWDENTPVITMPEYANNMDYRRVAGSSFGVSAKYALTNWLFGRADIVWIQKNHEINRTGYSAANFLNTTYKNNYINIPIMAMVSFGYEFRVFGYFGGYMGYWLSGNRTGNVFSLNLLLDGDIKSTEFDEKWEFDSERDNRFDAGFVYGGGIALTVAKHYEISVEGRWFLGQTDVQKDYMKNRIPHYNTTMVVQGGVAYKF